jgi:hypothetical protein
VGEGEAGVNKICSTATKVEATMLKTVEQKRGEAFFRSLADDNLLRLVGALVGRERGPAELAELLDLKPPVLARLLEHLTRLRLVTGRVDAGATLYQLDLAALRRYLVDEEYLKRDHGVYWRDEESRGQNPEVRSQSVD